MGNEIIGESKQIREGFENTKNGSWEIVGLFRFSFIEGVFLFCDV